LRNVGGSRLLFHHTLGGRREVPAEFCDPIARIFRSHGISSRRLDFIGGLPPPEHLEALLQGDLGLDTFPYHGATTTFECLWMGVPVLSLAGGTHVSRAGVSILTSARLTEWIALTPEEYVAKATEMARRPKLLSDLRGSLRGRMRTSKLTDGVD